MNNVAISNHLLVNLLQNQNVKREIVKKKDIRVDETNEEIVEEIKEETHEETQEN